MLKRIKHKIQEFDWIWSIPLGVLGFFSWGLFSEYVLKDPSYSSEWFHRGILAVLLLLLFHASSQIAMIFNFRGLYKYFYSKSSTIKDDFKEMPQWLKVFSPIFVWLLLLAAHILVFKMI
jgi:hypothetical protein